MGLDAVEVVMEVEEEFGIVIPNEDAGDLPTVGDLESYILAQVNSRDAGLSPQGLCRSTWVFLKLRQALTERFEVKRQDVRLATELDALLPNKNRTLEWDLVASSLGLRLPPLERPLWGSYLCLLGATSFVAALTAPAWSPQLNNAFVVLTMVGLLILSPCLGFVGLAAQDFAGQIPHCCADVRGMTTTLVTTNSDAIRNWDRRRAPEDVWAPLKNIVVEHLGVRPEEVTRDARFIEDLGCD